MKLNIRHLGPIQEAQVEIKPLTLFVGPNGTGKTLAAYAFSAGMSSWYSEKIVAMWRQKRPMPLMDPLQLLVAELAEEAYRTGVSSVDLAEWGRQWLHQVIRARFEHLPAHLPAFLDAQRMDVSKTALEIEFHESELMEDLLAVGYEWELGETDEGQPLLRMEKQQSEPRFIIVYAGKEKIPQPQLEALILRHLQAVLVPFTDVVFFPITRGTALELFPGGYSVGASSGSEEEGSRKPRPPTRTVPVPWALHLSRFTRCLRASPALRDEHADADDAIDLLRTIPDFLEVIQGGRYEVEPLHGTPRLTFVQDDVGPIDMSLASSMTKELASLALYLRMEAQPGDLLVIDEPEMNLHPEAQLEMMEFVAMMVNSDLNVIMTTHSPYMIDHLVNLMKASRSADPDSLEDKFKLHSSEAFIPQEKVSVSLFADGTAIQVLNEEGQIDLGTFAGASDFVSNLYFEL